MGPKGGEEGSKCDTDDETWARPSLSPIAEVCLGRVADDAQVASLEVLETPAGVLLPPEGGGGGGGGTEAVDDVLAKGALVHAKLCNKMRFPRLPKVRMARF